MEGEEPDGDGGEIGGPPLQSVAEENEERQREIQDEEHHADHRPRRAHPDGVELGLLGDVRDPDQHELEERRVRPEDREREQQPAERVIVRLAQRDEAGALRGERRDGEQGDRAQEPAGEVVDGVHRRVPRRFEAHQPVEGRERHREPDRGERAGAQRLHPRAVVGARARVPPQRPAPEQRRDRDPDGEVERRAHEEERQVEVRAAVLDEVARVLARDRIGPEPRVEGREPEEQRDEEHREQRHHRGDGLGEAAHRDGPAGPHRVADHQEDQRTDGDAGDVRVRDEVGEEELGAIDGRADQEPRRPEDRRPERPPDQARAVEHDRRRQRSASRAFAASGGGRSESATPARICRARTYATTAQRSAGSGRSAAYERIRP